MNISQKDLLQLKGWYISDCVVRNRNYFHFSMRNTKESRKASVISEHTVRKAEVGVYFDKEPEKALSFATVKNWEQVFIGSSVGDGWDEVVCVDDEGRVYARATDLRHIGREKNIPCTADGPSRGTITRIRRINGRLYFISYYHGVGYRIGPNEWQSLCMNLPAPRDENEADEMMDDLELEDIDGFSFDDLYLVGCKGHVWHFDGKEWIKVAFPSNIYLKSVCCAGDGFVYIGGQSGVIFKGRGDKWVKIHDGSYSLPFKDIVWHANKIWCTSDYGLWNIENNKIITANAPAEITICSGNLSVADGVMLLAGLYSAAFHDGKDWHILFDVRSIQDEDDYTDDADQYDHE
ncbi:TPA: hypothetical protein ACGR7Q_004820 [Escherichia coli]